MARLLRSILTSLVLVAAPSAAPAQTLADYDYEDLSFRGIGLNWGPVWPDKVESTYAVGLRFDLGYLGPAVRIVPTISYWSGDMKRSELTRLADALNQLPPLQQEGVVITAEDLGDVEWADLSFGFDAHAVFTLPYDVMTYAGAGLALHVLNGRGGSISDTFIEDLLDTVAPGFAVMGGVEYEPVRHLRLYGEARYSLTSDVRYPQVHLGAAFMISGGGGRNGGGND